jgi:hypothetical protein
MSTRAGEIGMITLFFLRRSLAGIAREEIALNESGNWEAWQRIGKMRSETHAAANRYCRHKKFAAKRQGPSVGL